MSTHKTQVEWASTPLEHRIERIVKLAKLLEESERLARVATLEMGKPLREAQAEVAKCGALCHYYATHGAHFLADEEVEGNEGRQLVTFTPLGVILGIMPWNFPFWQAMRYAVPVLLAGNGVLLKHASNVTGCAYALEQLFMEAGVPRQLFRVVVLPTDRMYELLAHPLVAAVTLTGSEAAGASVASQCGKLLKKTVLELGGSDPFIVLEDANIDLCVTVAAKSRLMNCGQSCIAAKRFLVVETVYKSFLTGLITELERWRQGDPFDAETDLGPLARDDLCASLDKQVDAAVRAGAVVRYKARVREGKGFFYPVTVLTDVTPEMSVCTEETFGPVFSVIAVRDADHALDMANNSAYGLGGSIWTDDLERGERLARRLEVGTAVVNGMTHSDPAMPFGGVKKSGYGRELSQYGLKEFVNVKAIKIY